MSLAVRYVSLSLKCTISTEYSLKLFNFGKKNKKKEILPMPVSLVFLICTTYMLSFVYMQIQDLLVNEWISTPDKKERVEGPVNKIVSYFYRKKESKNRYGTNSGPRPPSPPRLPSQLTTVKMYLILIWTIAVQVSEWNIVLFSSE